jgi:hypothetical protein
MTYSRTNYLWGCYRKSRDRKLTGTLSGSMFYACATGICAISTLVGPFHRKWCQSRDWPEEASPDRKYVLRIWRNRYCWSSEQTKHDATCTAETVSRQNMTLQVLLKQWVNDVTGTAETVSRRKMMLQVLLKQWVDEIWRYRYCWNSE